MSKTEKMLIARARKIIKAVDRITEHAPRPASKRLDAAITAARDASSDFEDFAAQVEKG